MAPTRWLSADGNRVLRGVDFRFLFVYGGAVTAGACERVGDTPGKSLRNGELLELVSGLWWLQIPLLLARIFALAEFRVP